MQGIFTRKSLETAWDRDLHYGGSLFADIQMELLTHRLERGEN